MYKKSFAIFLSLLLTLSLFSGCGLGSPTAKDTVTGDPTDPAGYYQWTYDVEGLGKWVNYFHLYDESSIGKVYYFGAASNQITQAGTYEILNESCDYEVYFERGTDDAPAKLQTGTTDYTIVFYDFTGAEVGRCAYDGAYIYNDTETVCGTGCEQVRMARDKDGLDSTYGQADSGYGGEAGIAFLKAANAQDPTLTLRLNHNGTYQDLIGEYETEGTWEQDSFDSYTLTPSDTSLGNVTLKISMDETTCTYTAADGTALELAIDNSKPLFKDLGMTFHHEEMQIDIEVDVFCYTDQTCELYLSVMGIGLSFAQGKYSTNEDGTLSIDLGDFGKLTTNSDFETEISIDANDFGLGQLEGTLAPR